MNIESNMSADDKQSAARQQLSGLRGQIDEIDNEILDVFVRRFEITKQVGRVKHAGGLAPEDPNREGAMYERLREMAAQRDLEPDVVEDIYRALLSHVKRQHRTIADQ